MGYVRCVVCDCKLPNGERTKVEHIRGLQHRRRIERPFEKTSTGLDCVICDCQVPNHEHNKIEHLRGRRHRDMVIRPYESIDEEEEPTTEDCENNDGFEEYSEYQEFDYNDYRSNMSNSEMEYPFEVTATGRVECVICECEVPNNGYNLDEHINGMRHCSMVM